MENQEIAELKAQLKQAQDDAELMANAYVASLIEARNYIELMVFVLPLLDKCQSGQRPTVEELKWLWMEIGAVEGETAICDLPLTFEQAWGFPRNDSDDGFIEWNHPPSTPEYFTNEHWLPRWSAFLRNVSVDDQGRPIPKDQLVRRLPK